MKWKEHDGSVFFDDDRWVRLESEPKACHIVDLHNADIDALTAERDALARRINTDGAPVDVAALCLQPGRSFASPTNAHEERMLRWFTYDHLPPHLQAVSAPFCELAALLAHTLKPGPERTVTFRKLLEAKDAAVRAALHPGA